MVLYPQSSAVPALAAPTAVVGERGRTGRLTVFVRHENVLRLLEFMGYRQDE
jgi:hypothetical protein